MELTKKYTPSFLLLYTENQPDEAEMHSQGAVDARAVDAQEHTVWDTCPAGIFGSAVKAYLSKNTYRELHLVGER